MATKKKIGKGGAPEAPRLPNEVTRALGQNLKRYRLAIGKTQLDLAYDAEVERSRISKLESGLVNPSILTLAALCHCLGITLPMLFQDITVTIRPLAQGGPRRRANQAVLEKEGTSSRRAR